MDQLPSLTMRVIFSRLFLFTSPQFSNVLYGLGRMGVKQDRLSDDRVEALLNVLQLRLSGMDTANVSLTIQS
jgi:hypothetical protein